MILLRLYLEFVKVGLFSVGGGLATLPFLYDLSDRTGWFSYQDIANMIAIAESTPGPIGVNMATFAGYTTAGIPGGLIATLGLISPAILIIMIIARLLDKFMGNPFVESAFYGLRPASVALIAAAGLGVVKITLLNIPAFTAGSSLADLFVWKAILFAVILFLAQRFLKKISPVFFIFASAIVGIVFHFGT